MMYVAYVIAAMLYAVGYLAGKAAAMVLWLWAAFLEGYKAGL